MDSGSGIFYTHDLQAFYANDSDAVSIVRSNGLCTRMNTEYLFPLLSSATVSPSTCVRGISA